MIGAVSDDGNVAERRVGGRFDLSESVGRRAVARRTQGLWARSHSCAAQASALLWRSHVEELGARRRAVHRVKGGRRPRVCTGRLGEKRVAYEGEEVVFRTTYVPRFLRAGVIYDTHRLVGIWSPHGTTTHGFSYAPLHCAHCAHLFGQPGYSLDVHHGVLYLFSAVASVSTTRTTTTVYSHVSTRAEQQRPRRRRS